MADKSSPDFATLIPDLPNWNDGAGIDAEGWIGCVGTYDLAIGYSLIFWPRFIEFDRYVLRAAHFSAENVRDWERSANNDRQAIEAVINHVHLVDIHCNTDPTEVQLRYLGRILRNAHEAKLKLDFPDRAFEVVFNDEPNLDLVEYEVTFWQVG